MTEDCRHPSPRLRAAAESIHQAAVWHHWVGRHYLHSYSKLESVDPLGFEEFNEIIAAALTAADAAPPR